MLCDSALRSPGSEHIPAGCNCHPSNSTAASSSTLSCTKQVPNKAHNLSCWMHIIWMRPITILNVWWGTLTMSFTLGLEAYLQCLSMDYFHLCASCSLFSLQSSMLTPCFSFPSATLPFNQKHPFLHFESDEETGQTMVEST